MIRPFDYRDTGNRSVDDALKRVKEKFREVLGALLMEAIAIKATKLLSASSSTRVPHGLRHVPKGWFVAGKDANANVWSTKAADKDALYLKTSTDVTVALVVF
jgi:hypothetical protein